LLITAIKINIDLIQPNPVFQHSIIPEGAYPESSSYHKRTLVGAASSRDHFVSRLEAAPTTDSTCSFQITAFQKTITRDCAEADDF